MQNEDIKVVNETISNLETNLLSVINELKASTSVILKELTVYLNVSANDITKIRDSQQKTDSLVDKINNYIEKLDFIENEILKLPQSMSELSSDMKTQVQAQARYSHKLANLNTQNMKKMSSVLSKKLDTVQSRIESNRESTEELTSSINSMISEWKTFREDLNKDQEQLYEVINSLISGKEQESLAEIDLKKTGEQSEIEKYKSKINLYIKIVGALVSSGGVFWFIIQIIQSVGGAP